MKRILVEFYSHRPPENLISLLKERYDGAYFLYFTKDRAPSAECKKQICLVVKEILGFEPQFKGINPPSIPRILEVLSALLKKDTTLDIDITGENEIFIAAAGIFLSRHATAPIFLHCYDIKSGKELCRYPSSPAEKEPFPRYLSVPQFLSLNGTPPLSAPSHHFTYGELRNEILRLWQAVGKYSREWNQFCSLPCDPQGNKNVYSQKLVGTKESHRQSYHTIAQKLKAAGILKHEKQVLIHGKAYMEFELDVSKDALFLYEKAGNLLEMYMAMVAFDSGCFHDIRVGVSVDWNGHIAPTWQPDPRNEIDLILMYRNLPVFASCKNTFPQNEYLYEISTMSQHYGGPFAASMLLASGNASPTVRERAKEMGILMIDGIRKKEYAALVAQFQKHFSQN